MPGTRSLRAATLLVAAALLIAALWWRALWPMLTRTGPSPGAHAQYVYVLLPSAALAVLVAALGALQAACALRAGTGLRAGLLLALGILGIGATAAFLVPGGARAVVELL